MATAEELLSAIHLHNHTVVDSDTYFIIDPVSRTLENTARKKNVIMQYDHNSEIFTFELARYVEGHDMMLCTNVIVHWNNIDGETGEETAESTDLYDLRINPENEATVICSWPVSRNSTQRVGILSFLVQYKCVDKDGAVPYEWHTDIYDGIEIRKSRDNGPQSVIEYTDILEQWRTKLFGISDSEASKILALSQEQQDLIGSKTAEVLGDIELKAAETLETIPDDYTTVYQMAEEALRTKADAIVLSEEGSVISVDDSSDNYLQNLKLYGKTEQITTIGKNLINTATATPISHESIAIDGNDITIAAGTGIYGVKFTDINLEIGQTYSFSVGSVSEHGGSWGYRLHYTDDTFSNNAGDKSMVTITIEKAVDIVYFYVYYNGDSTSSVTISKLQCELGAVVTGFEPYTGGVAAPNPNYPRDLLSVVNPTVKVLGKNLLNLPSVIAKTNTLYNYDLFTETVGASQIVPSTYFDKLPILKAGVDYYFSYNIPENVPNKLILVQKVEDDGQTSVRTILLEGPGVVRVEEDTMVTLRANSSDTYTIENIQLEVGSQASAYEPHKSAQPIILDRILRGIPVTSGGNYTDQNGQQWVCDEIDFDRQVYIQRIGTVTLDGDEHWAYYSSGDGVNQFYTIVNDCYTNNALVNAMSPQMRGISVANRSYNYNTVYTALQSPYNYICVNIKGYTNQTDFKAFLAASPIDVIYRLREPVETALTSEEILGYKALKTNYPNTVVTSDPSCHVAIKYVVDNEIYLREHYGEPTDEQVTSAVNVYLDQNGVQVPSDEHINSLINVALGVIENGSY